MSELLELLNDNNYLAYILQADQIKVYDTDFSEEVCGV